MEQYRIKQLLIGSVMSLLCSTSPALAVFGIGDVVLDPTNLVQNTTAALNAVKTAANTAQQVTNQYKMIEYQVNSITHQVTNLQRLDFNTALRLLTIGQSIVMTLRQARGISYDLDTAITQFDALYPAAAGVLVSANAIEQQTRWVTERRNAALLAVQVQSITASLTQSYGRVCELLNASHAAQGNLDSLQIAAQQEALSQAIALQRQQMEAGQARLQATREAEDATRAAVGLQALDRALPALPTYDDARGRLVNYEATGKAR